MAVAEGSGCTQMFECKYHGWCAAGGHQAQPPCWPLAAQHVSYGAWPALLPPAEGHGQHSLPPGEGQPRGAELRGGAACRKYDLKGAFRGCTQMEGVKRFYADELALRPIRVETLGPFMWVLFNNDQCAPPGPLPARLPAWPSDVVTEDDPPASSPFCCLRTASLLVCPAAVWQTSPCRTLQDQAWAAGVPGQRAAAHAGGGHGGGRPGARAPGQLPHRLQLEGLQRQLCAPPSLGSREQRWPSLGLAQLGTGIASVRAQPGCSLQPGRGAFVPQTWTRATIAALPTQG